LPPRAHRYASDGIYEVTVSVADGADTTEGRFGITVANVAPRLIAPGDQRSAEGSAVAFDLGRFADPGAEGRWAVTVDWGDGSAAESFEVASPGPLGARPHRYERDGTYEVVVSVSDGRDSTDSAFLVSVANVAPRLLAPGAQRAAEGEAVPILLGSFADPGAEGTWTVTVDWGDGSPLESFEVDSPGLLPPRAHRYGQDGTYEVRVSVADGRAEAGSTFLVSVANVPPTLLVPAGQEASEGAEVPLLLGSFADPGAEGRWVVTVDWGDGSAAESFEVDSPGPLGVRPHRFERDGAYELTVRVADGSGQGESTSRILVRNEPPRLGNAWASSRVEAGAPIDLFATFSDPGRLDTFSALIDWGDGTTSRIDLGVGSTSVTSRHVIDRAGSFRITLTLADDRGAASTVSLPVTVFVPDPLTPPGPGPGPGPIGPPSLPAFPGLSADQILAIGLLSPPVGSLPGLPGAGSPGASATAAPPLGPSIGTLQGPSAGGAGPGPTAPDLPPALSPLATPEEAPTPPPPAADAVSGAEATVEGAVDSSQAPQLAGGGQDLGADEQAIQATFQETGFSAEEAPAPALAAAGPAPGGGSAPSQDAPAATGTRMMMLLLALICLRRQRPLTARRLTGAALQGGKD
jgi:hypothetical protein